MDENATGERRHVYKFRVQRNCLDFLTLVAFAAIIIVIGGVNFVAVRFSNRDLPPFWGAAIRFAGASPHILEDNTVRFSDLTISR